MALKHKQNLKEGLFNKIRKKAKLGLAGLAVAGLIGCAKVEPEPYCVPLCNSDTSYYVDTLGVKNLQLVREEYIGVAYYDTTNKQNDKGENITPVKIIKSTEPDSIDSVVTNYFLLDGDLDSYLFRKEFDKDNDGNPEIASVFPVNMGDKSSFADNLDNKIAEMYVNNPIERQDLFDLDDDGKFDKRTMVDVNQGKSKIVGSDSLNDGKFEYIIDSLFRDDIFFINERFNNLNEEFNHRIERNSKTRFKVVFDYEGDGVVDSFYIKNSHKQGVYYNHNKDKEFFLMNRNKMLEYLNESERLAKMRLIYQIDSSYNKISGLFHEYSYVENWKKTNKYFNGNLVSSIINDFNEGTRREDSYSQGKLNSSIETITKPNGITTLRYDSNRKLVREEIDINKDGIPDIVR